MIIEGMINWQDKSSDMFLPTGTKKIFGAMHVIVFLLEIDHFQRWDMVNPWIKLTGINQRIRKLIVIPLITSACRRYKQCLQCVRMSNGEECIGEMVTYNQDETDGSCSDAGGSCERGLCECDAAFAEGKFIIIFAYVNVPHGERTTWNY